MTPKFRVSKDATERGQQTLDLNFNERHAQSQKAYTERKKIDSDRRCVWVPKERSVEFTLMFKKWLSSGTD
tara:strand:- start:222 stop:434 length:213 start_codon:yes stop_codon:yes gene_type:complete